MEAREIALNLLAANEGSYLIFDFLDHPKAAKIDLTKDELWNALMALEKEGLVAYMQERLDGPLFSLSKSGRNIMAQKGFIFDDSKIAKSRQLFSSSFCKTEI